MEFFKKYWKHIVGVLVYTILVVFISITSYKWYLGQQLQNVFTNAFSDISNDSSNSENSKIKNDNNSNNIVTPIKEISINETIHTQDWEITFKGTEFLQDVMPPTPDSFYTHYQVKDTTNTYLVAKFDIKNISTISLTADENLSLKAIYDKKYEYNGFSTLLSPNNGSFDYVNITAIPPLTSRTLYYLIEMPKDITEDEKSIDIHLTAYQEKYTFNIDKNVNAPTIKTQEQNITNSIESNKTTKTSSKSTNKAEPKSENPYEENVVLFRELSGSNNTGTSLDNYINTYITNEPVPELKSNQNSDTTPDYLIRGTN